MTRQPDYSLEPSSASDSPALVVEATTFTASFDEFSSWLDERLVALEDAFADFSTRKSVVDSLGRS